jgi:hypothetical protein
MRATRPERGGMRAPMRHARADAACARIEGRVPW